MRSVSSSLAALLALVALHAIALEPATGGAVHTAGAEWPSYNRSLDGQRYSPLTQINAGNAGELVEACRIQLAERGSLQSGLVVIDGVMYATTATDTIALDPVTCETLWRHRYRRAVGSPFPVNRGVAHYAGRLFRGTDDGRVIALDARTGAEIWTNVVGDPAEGELVTGAPLAWNGIVVVGTAASEFGVRGRVIAYDAMSGRELWRFHTVPAPGEPNADTWRDTVWNDIGGGGGGTWSHFALDPSTNELFVPVGNPIPDFVPAERLGDNLYTNSVLVLDALSGALKWWYQLAPNDGLDHDLAAAPVLYRDSEGRRRMVAAGKDGYAHIVDRRSHALVAKTAVTTVDEPVPVPTPEGVKGCPGPAGGVEWNGPAFDPKLNRLYVGALDYCATFYSTPGTEPEIPGYNMGGTWSGIGTPRGWIHALDATTGAVVWRYHAERPVIAALTPTAGGVLLGGDNAGNFLVFEAASGRLLHELDTGGSLSGGIITYEVRGRQYVAMTSGNVSRSVFGAVGRPSIVVLTLSDAALVAQRSGAASELARGQALYNASCAVCHGADGAAWNPIDLKSVKRRMSRDELVAFIKEPRAPMPKMFPAPLSQGDEAAIRAIATFLMQWE